MEKILDTVKWETLIDKSYNWLINTIPILILILILGLIGLKIWSMVIRQLREIVLNRAIKQHQSKTEAEKRVNTLVDIVRVAGKVGIWAILIMITLKEINIDIGPLLASLGILGLAIGFGAQELVRDIVSGFFILLENHIRVGDVAIINGTGGLVENIGLRTTSLRDLSGVVHVFQNGKINSLSNMTKEWSAMVFDIGIAYKENTDVVVETMKAVADDLQNDEEYKDKILEPIEVFGVDNFGNSAVIIKARLKTLPIQQWTVGREYRRRLKKAFDQKGIEIPFPHSKIYWGEPIQISNDIVKE
ncbi:MAG: mechanosensitive ion channel family protein [Candidatus Cyclobacteriaceae bacterium M3_2C_046]